METKIFVVEIPTLTAVLEKIGELVGDVIPKVKENVSGCGARCPYLDDFDDEEVDDEEDELDVPQIPMPWGIGGEPADENLRFGAGFEIDEPRSSDYNSRWKFESDHAAFDRFVDAGEDCVARGLERKSNAPIHKCKAIRKNADEVPPMNVDLIGETDWWNNI